MSCGLFDGSFVEKIFMQIYSKNFWGLHNYAVRFDGDDDAREALFAASPDRNVSINQFIHFHFALNETFQSIS